MDRQRRLQRRARSSARRRSAEKGGCSASVEVLAIDGEALGRSRGGLTTKLHLAVDGRGLPIAVLLTAGQAGDNPQLLPLLAQVTVARRGPGGPRRRPERVIADRAYSHPSTRAALRARHVRFTCPERIDQLARRRAKGSAGGRPPAFDQQVYAGRNVIERCFADSSSSAPWPPATPNEPPTTGRCSSSPPSSSGSAKIRRTGLSDQFIQLARRTSAAPTAYVAQTRLKPPRLRPGDEGARLDPPHRRATP
ncbi:transposase [Geodermatophilus tzadiensis]|uniref:transposase n=1 Tax=Geodermatophilus tzadiensis TaxID=1137988 RepID=UPI003CCC0F43